MIIIGKSLSINEKSDNATSNQTPLHIASYEGRFDMVHLDGGSEMLLLGRAGVGFDCRCCFATIYFVLNGVIVARYGFLFLFAARRLLFCRLFFSFDDCRYTSCSQRALTSLPLMRNRGHRFTVLQVNFT